MDLNEMTLRKYRRAVEQSPSTVVITDLQGNIEYVNPKFEQLTGYTAEEVIGKNTRFLKSGEQPQEFYQELWDTINAGKEWRGEFHNKKKNDEFYWEFASISAVRDSNGNMTHFLAVKEDTTLRKNAEEKLREVNAELEIKNKKLLALDQLKSEFISVVSHELRTPLTVIREGVSQVLDGILGETTEEQREFLSIAIKNIDRLGRMINNLLDMAKIESGKVELHREKFNVIALVHEIIVSLSIAANEKGIAIKERLPAEEIEIYADKDKITQIVTNLLGNAIKFTNCGHINVAIADCGDYVECRIEDTGIGISGDNVPKLFDKFQQFARSDVNGEKGSGLGLSIVKSLIELHKGQLSVTSTLGEGSRFTFNVPKK